MNNKNEFSNYTWACRSAVQKAVRRSMPVLYEQCFRELWETDPQFLLRRTLIFAAEECWPLIADTFDLVQEARGYIRKGAGPKARRQGRLYLQAAGRRLVMATKAKDAAALASLAYGEYGKFVLKDPIMMKQFKAMVTFHKICEKGGSSKKKIWAILHKKAEVSGSEYAVRMVKACGYGYAMGGMVNEPHKFLAAAIMVLSEYLEMPEVVLDTSLSFKIEKKEKIPLFAYDQHTRVGKSALYRAARDLETTYARLSFLQFNKVSAVITPEREGEKWWPLRCELVDKTIKKEKWEAMEKVINKQIIKGLKEE